MQKYVRDLQMNEQQIQKIKKRFEDFSSNGCMTLQQFKKSMGLLGVGGAQQLSNRLFSLISKGNYFTVQEFIDFLDKINNGTVHQKAALSFQYLNRKGNGFIEYDDIVAIISEILFVWNFLTGEKISTTFSIDFICKKLGISEQKEINFNEYLSKYDHYFDWYGFFNSSHKGEQNQDKQYYTTMRNNHNEFKIDQIEEYLKLIHGEIELLLYRFRQQQSDSYESRNLYQQFAFSKGPNPVSTKQFQLQGDRQFNPRETLPYLSHQQLSRQIFTEGDNIYDIIANKLQQLGEISSKLFSTSRQPLQSARQKSNPNFIQQQRKKAILNITKPTQNRRNIIYFGHQSWNLMLNMMLGIRRSLKSHYYKFSNNVTFSEEDLNCKYYHQLIYKYNQKSVKEISQIFVDYSPKVFYYIRKYFNIDNSQFLKSIGLQNLIGNLLMGNLSTLSDQTSEGKSGSFMYYTQDSKIIVKSISRDEYRKLREILNPYVEHIRNNPQTFLVRIYGLYKMKNKSSGRQIYFMVIGNVFDRQIEINERYDVKGATHNRQTIQNGHTFLQHSLYNKNMALKDVDLINSERKFDIQTLQKTRIYEQILADAQFLKNHNIIQYSLLIGIHKLQQSELNRNRFDNQHSLFSKNIPRSKQIIGNSKKESYFFGIIDILSEYSTKKMFENKLMGMFNDISCKDPEEYYQRFQRFIFKYIFR